jgi:hypothetical protein
MIDQTIEFPIDEADRRARIADGSFEILREIRDPNRPINGNTTKILRELLEISSSLSMPERLDSFADAKSALGEIIWDWHGWIPRGYLLLLVAAGGLGKSMLAMRILRNYILGGDFPDGQAYKGGTGKALWVEAESGQQANVSRAVEMGIPLERIIFPASWDCDITIFEERDRLKIEHAARLEDVKVVIVDSLSASNNGREREAEIIPTVKWMAWLARSTQKPILVTHHLRKAGIGDSDVVTLDRVRGHTAITQLARIVWALDIPDPTDTGNIRLSVIKSNLSEMPRPLGFRLQRPCVFTFGPAPAPPRVETVADRTRELLLSILADGPVPTSEVLDALKAHGISERTYRRVKREMSLVSVKKGNSWLTSLPIF